MNKNGFPLCLVFTVEFPESLYFNQILYLYVCSCVPLRLCVVLSLHALFELLRHAYKTRPELSIVGIKGTGAF